MGEVSESVLPLEERIKYFPWIAEVNKRFLKCFPSDYDEETLDFFHREIENELGAISIRSTKKNEALFSTLLCFYNNLCWKTKWKKRSPHMKLSCARVLSSICRVGLVLSKGKVQSKWINQVLSAVSVFPGDNDYLYEALLRVYKFNKKYYSAYAAVLRHILRDPQPKTENPCTFFKLLLLFRRLKFLLPNPYEKARVDALAAAVAIPRNLMSWLADNELQDVSKAMKKNKMIIMKGKFANVLLVRLREAVLHNTYRETSPVSKYDEDTLFSIDCNPATENRELSSNSLNMEEDIIVNTVADVEISKSKRKSAVQLDESNMGSAAKKGKKKDLDNKLKEKRTAIKQSPTEIIHNNDVSEIPIEYTESDVDSNTPSKSKKKLKKNRNTKFDQVPQREVNEVSVDINLKEESESPISTNGDEIENDSMLIQSYSSAIQSIKKGKKKRNIINIAEELKDIENEASINENDLVHVHSIKKGKKKRKTINIVEDIEKSSNLDENESSNVQFAKRDQKSRANMNVVQKPQDVENELVVNEKTVSSAKKGKKRKSINISQENVLNDRGGQSDSETDVSLYVQSIGTGKNRRKTINIAQYTSQRDIEKDLLNVPNSNKSKKKRQTINNVEEINPKNFEYQSKFNENYSFCTPPVTLQGDFSSTPGSASKTNKKRKSSHFTSADFIVTPCENVDSVAKENFNEDVPKRTSISTKSEWIVTVDKSDSETIPLTHTAPTEKHNFKISEITKTIPEAVAKETIDYAEVEAIAERNNAKDIVTPLTLASTTSESETINTEDEEADESISESESLDTAEKAKSSKYTDKTGAFKPIAKAVTFVEETESIVSTNDETEAANTEDDDKSISETESIDRAEEAKSSESSDEAETIGTKMVKFVEGTESIISTNEIEAANSDDEEAYESISETEYVGTAEEAESSGETEAIMPITETVKFVDEAETIVSTNGAEAFESIDKPGECNSLEVAGTVKKTVSKGESVKVTESVEKVVIVNETMHVASTDNTEFSEPVASAEKVEIAEEKIVEAVKNTDSIEMFGEIKECNDVGPSDKTDIRSIPEPVDERNAEDAGAVEIIEKIKEVDSAREAFESIRETEDITVEDVETDEVKGTDIIEETEAVNSFNKTEDFECILETKEETMSKVQTGETVEEVKKVDIVESETNDFTNEIKHCKPISEMEGKIMEDVEIIVDANTANFIEETEYIGSINISQDFEPIPETEEEEIMENVETVVDTNAVNTIEETEDMGPIYKSQHFKPISETNEIIEETEDIDSASKTDGFESVPATEEETVTTEDIIVDSGAIEIIEETEDIYSFKKPDDIEPIPETNGETVEEVVEGSEEIEIIKETEDIDSTKKIEEFEPIPETEESEINVEPVEGVEAIKIIEETKDIICTNKIEECTNKIESADIVEETENIDSTHRTKHFLPIAETKEGTDNNAEALEAVVIKETTCSTPEETTTVSIDETKTIPTVYQAQTVKNDTGTKTLEDMEAMDVVKDKDANESIDEAETVKSIAEPEAINIIQETDVKASDEIEALELIKGTNTNECIETDGTYIKAKAVKTVQEKLVEKAEGPENLESSDKTETEDSDEILEINNSTDRTETEDTDEYLEIIESSDTDDKTEAKESGEQLENFESNNKAKTENIGDKSGDTECIAEKKKVAETKNVIIQKVSRKYGFETVSNSTHCFSDISESELDTSITKYNSLVKEIFCDAVSDDSVRESLSPYKIENVKKHSIESVSSQSVMSPRSGAEILENNLSLTKNCEVSLLNSNIYLNSSEKISDEGTEIEDAAPINNTQYYCKLLLKEVTEDNFAEDFDNEAVDKSKNNVDLELPKNIPNQSSSEEIKFDSQTQLEGHSSTKMDISSSEIVVETISNNENEASKETETVESIAEGLYKKILKAKEKRLSLTNSVPEKTADDILTENTVSYVIGKVIKKVEDVSNTDTEKSFADLKEQIKFTPERSHLPKLGNLSNLKPFGFPNEKSECLSFVDFSKEKVSDSTEIESSESSPLAKGKDFYPYRNLLAIEVLDDKSESNFPDLVLDDKLEETICVPNEEDSSDDETEIDEDVSQSPVCNITRNDTFIEEPQVNEESQTSVLETQNSPKLDTEELNNLVRTMKVPVVNLGHKCDDVRFESEVSQHDNDVACSHDKIELLLTKTEKQVEGEDIVESQMSISISQESKESKPENEEVITTRKLRNRNVSLSVVTDKSTYENKDLTLEKSSHTRSRRKQTNQETSKSTESNSEATSTNLRRSTRRLRNEFKELRLDSPKRCNPVDEVTHQKVNTDSNLNSTTSKKLTTRSTTATKNDSAVSKMESNCSDPSVEVDQETDLPKDTSNNSSTRKRATRSTATPTKITKYFLVQTKAKLTPVNEIETENPVEDSTETGTEKLPVKKRFTRSNAFASDKLRSELFDAKEDVKDANLGDIKSKNTVPKRSTRTTTRGASRTKLSQNTPAKEESDEEDVDTHSNISEESHKENVANEDESASKEVESSPKEYNLRRSARNLIRPSRLKLSQDHF